MVLLWYLKCLGERQPTPLGRPEPGKRLTTAEAEVVEWVRKGLTNAAISRKMGIGADAVKQHVANALHKSGLARRADVRSGQAALAHHVAQTKSPLRRKRK